MLARKGGCQPGQSGNSKAGRRSGDALREAAETRDLGGCVQVRGACWAWSRGLRMSSAPASVTAAAPATIPTSDRPPSDSLMQSHSPLRNREPLMSFFALPPNPSTTIFTCMPDLFRRPQATVLPTEGDAIAIGVAPRISDHESNREFYSALVTRFFLTSPTALLSAAADLLLLASARVSTFAVLGTRDGPPTATLA
jgi:hypothetical protein